MTPTCPKCGEEIEGLDCRQMGTQDSYVWLEDDELHDEPGTLNSNSRVYMCPHCSTTLVTNEEAAIEILTEEPKEPKEPELTIVVTIVRS